MWVQGNVVLVYVLVQTLRAQNLRDLDELVIIVVSMEEGFFSENLGLQVRDARELMVEPRTMEANMQP